MPPASSTPTAAELGPRDRVASEQRLYPMLGRSHLGLPSGFFGLDG